MKHDPALLARLQQAGHDSIRALVWRLGQAVAFAAIFHARAGDPAMSREWHDKAIRLGKVIGVEPPPLFARQQDRRQGSADALRYLLQTVGDAMGPGIARYGSDHAALFECAVKLCLIDFVGAGSKEMLAAIGSAVRDRARRGGLPESFQQTLSRIVAQVGDEATKLIFAAYEEVFALLTSDEQGPAPAPDDAAPSPSQPPATGARDQRSRPVVDTPAGARLQIYLLATVWAGAAVSRRAPDGQDDTEDLLRRARERAATLGLELPELPPCGEHGEDLADQIGSLLAAPVARIAAALSASHGDDQGALFEATATMHLWAALSLHGHPRDADRLLSPMVAALTRAGLPSWRWGFLVVLDIGRVQGKAFDATYATGCVAIREHLEAAAREGSPDKE